MPKVLISVNSWEFLEFSGFLNGFAMLLAKPLRFFGVFLVFSMFVRNAHDVIGAVHDRSRHTFPSMIAVAPTAN